MKKYTTHITLVIIFLIFFGGDCFAGKIVYPWRATTSIVKSGENFEVWLNADAGQR